METHRGVRRRISRPRDVRDREEHPMSSLERLKGWTWFRLIMACAMIAPLTGCRGIIIDL